MDKILESLRAHVVRIGLGMAVLVFFLLHASGTLSLGFIHRMENLAYDARLLFSLVNAQDPRIVIVDIDEKSLAAEGRWPWGRDRMAQLVERMFDKYKVSLVGFDIVFAEPDESSGLKILESLAEGDFKTVPGYRERLDSMRARLDNDRLFAESLRGRPVVLGYYFNTTGPADAAPKVGALPSPTFAKGIFQGKKVSFLRAVGHSANLAEFQAAAVGAGHFNPSLDADGLVRRVPMLYEYDGAHYESLSLAVARVALGARDVVPRFEEAPWGASRTYTGLEWLQVGDRLVPVDEHVQALVPYRSRKGGYPYVSATDVLNDGVDPVLLKGAIVLVGTTAPGLFDLRATPVQEAFPGVEIHANLISGILDQTIKQRPAYTLGAEFILILLVGLVMAIALPLLSPLAATGVTILLLWLSVAFNLLVWHGADLVLPVASTIIMILVMFLINMSYGYFVETRGKRQLTGLFGHYVPPELVDEMSKNPGAYSLEADSREMTVLFSDVRGFTSISEGLNPKQLSELMNAFLTPMTRVIHKHRGTIDKYMGDAVMAFWGAPLPDRDHARHALDAAMEMIATAKQISEEFRARGWPPIKIGAGVNTGVMSVGNMGSEFRIAYTVLGDAVNLGSRLEGLTKGYGVDVIVSETTKEAVPDYAYRELDRVRVKGKDKPVHIYEPLGRAAELDKAMRDELQLYKQALAYYRAQNWDMAELQFLNLQKQSRLPGLYKMYAERVAHFRQNPPGADWDGVFTYTTK